MGIWENYADRSEARGGTRRGAAKDRFYQYTHFRLPHNLSYQQALVDGNPMSVAVISSDNLNQKYIYSMPGGDLPHGGLVFWEDNYWLITDKDPHNEMYCRCVMLQCNHLLKWIDKEHNIHEQWCIVEDGTKLTHAGRTPGLARMVWHIGNGMQKRLLELLGHPESRRLHNVRMKQAWA